MVVGINEILIGMGTVISIWVINNYKLKEGITSWFVDRLGIDTYDIKNHNIKETLKKIILENNSSTLNDLIEAFLERLKNLKDYSVFNKVGLADTIS